jgi:hypothetical protein
MLRLLKIHHQVHILVIKVHRIYNCFLKELKSQFYEKAVMYLL